MGDSNNDRLIKLRASDGTLLGKHRVGDVPWGIAFDRGRIWVTNIGSNDGARLAIGGLVERRYPVGDEPRGILFDRTSIWVANNLDATVITPALKVTRPQQKNAQRGNKGRCAWIMNSTGKGTLSVLGGSPRR